MRLVAIFQSPAPYTTPVLNAVARQLDLHVVYLAQQDRVSRFEDTWGSAPAFDHSVHWCRRLDIPSVGLHTEVTAGIARRLSALDPDAILLVSWKPTALEPLLWTRWSGTAAVMWAESTSFSGLLREPVSTRVRAWVTRAFDGYVTNGSQAAEYLVQLGVPGERIVESRLPAAAVPATSDRAQGLSDDAPRFLFVGRLVPWKRPLELIDAFADVRRAVPQATLSIVGAGELEAEVRGASERVLGVEYLGRHEGAELAAIYAQSDILVLPSRREVWGVVVNEALSHGLFVVATDQVGSAHDLLDEESGLMLPESLEGLAPALIDVAGRLDLGDDARRRRALAVADCTPERFAADIVRAVDVAARVRGSRRRARRQRT